MTLEEKAEKYARKTKKVDWEGFDVDKEARKEGYIAGATENGIVWHNLQKNPKDFPKNSDDEKLYLVYYDAKEAIAWCEIPKYIEK